MRFSLETATVLIDKKEKVVPIEKIAVGNQILIMPGERIPVDARRISGILGVD